MNYDGWIKVIFKFVNICNLYEFKGQVDTSKSEGGGFQSLRSHQTTRYQISFGQIKHPITLEIFI